MNLVTLVVILGDTSSFTLWC